MNLSVVDTSALIRLYVPDGPVPQGLEEAVDAAGRGDAALLVPELALAEVGQVLLRKETAGVLSSSEAAEILEAVITLPLEVVGHRALMLTAAGLA